MINEKALWQLKALSDRTRLEIVEMLYHSPDPLMVEMIASRLNRPPSSISRHLMKLKVVGIVSSIESGRCHLFTIDSCYTGEPSLFEDINGNLVASIQLTKEEQSEAK